MCFRFWSVGDRPPALYDIAVLCYHCLVMLCCLIIWYHIALLLSLSCHAVLSHHLVPYCPIASCPLVPSSNTTLHPSNPQFDEPSIERYRRVVGFRFRYVGDRPSARPGSSAGPESGHGGGGEPAAAAAAAATGGMSERDQLSRCLDVDGELQDSELSSVDCR